MRRSQTAAAASVLCLTVGFTLGAPDAKLVSTPRELAPALQRLTIGDAVSLRVPIARGDETLELTRFDPLAPGALVIAMDEHAEPHPIDTSGLVLLKGTIAGDPDSLAFLAVSADQISGFVRSDGEVRVISSGRPGADRPVSSEVTRDLNIGNGAGFCDVDTDQPMFYPNNARPEPRPAGAGAPSRGVIPCRAARIAVDSDYEFTQLFGGNTTAAANYAITLLAASSTVYERDLNVRFVIPYVRVWAANNDPYFDSSGTVPFLFEMRDHWNTNLRHVPRETVHGLSGRSLGGGVAYVNALCNSEYGHGVSANLNGFFPMPVQDNSGSNWDLMVVSHELGHNFGTGHTHDINWYNPVVDGCGNGDCTNALDSTIMSYCHTCPGGLSNVDMRFHPRVQETILGFLDQIPCDLTAGASATAQDDFFELFAGQTADLDVLSNDAASSCTPASVVLLGFDAVSAQGASITVSSTAPFTGQRFVYTAPNGFSGFDSFDYTTNAGSATVTIGAVPLLPATSVATQPGVDVAYFVLSNPQQLPDFGVLTPYATDVVDDINFASTSGSFATSGRADGVGALFESLIEVPASGWYLLSVESDDGSRVWIDDLLVADNDGLHGMEEASGYVALEAGKHRVRTEFFENGGGAGLIVRYAGATITKQPVPAGAWSREPDCAADLAEPFGTLNFFDISAFVGLFNAQDPAADLAAPTGVWNFFDITEYITRFNTGCP